ncbi:MAG: glycosyltransferase family 2 protein [Flavisolibacter sp.]
MKHVDIVIPLFNEEENIIFCVENIQEAFKTLPYSYSVVLVDDGSTDNSLLLLRNLFLLDKSIGYISLSRNFGHQMALKAGIDQCQGDCLITMDGDGQHPASLIPDLLRRWEEGYDVVYTVRNESNIKMSFLKKFGSDIFYRLLNKLADLHLEKGAADFRLLTKRIVNIIQGMDEHELFIRGMVKWVGFRQLGISYEVCERRSGKTKYDLSKMIRFALQGITSFSTKPLYIAAYLGFSFSLVSLLYIPYILISYLFGHIVSGWMSLIVTIAFFGGMELSILGIIGLYLGKVFMQGKSRPLYLVKEKKLRNGE